VLYSLLLLVAATSGCARAQSVTLHTSDSAAPGAQTLVDIKLSAGSSQPLIVQWDLVFPSEQLSLDSGYPVIGDAARQAGKQLTCRGSWKKAPKAFAVRCMAAGGRDTIPPGVLATARFTVAPVRQTVKLPLTVENIEVLYEGLRLVKARKAGSVLQVVP
jgi:hypothetical protein